MDDCVERLTKKIHMQTHENIHICVSENKFHIKMPNFMNIHFDVINNLVIHKKLKAQTTIVKELSYSPAASNSRSVYILSCELKLFC